MCPGCNWVPPGLSLFPGSCRRQQFRLLIGSIIAVLQWPLQPDSPACADLQVLFHFFLAHLLMKYTVENDLLEIILQEQQYGSSIKDIRYLIYDSGDFCWSLGHLRKNKIVLTFQIHDWKKRKKITILSITVTAETHFFSPLLVLQGRTHPAANKGGQDPSGVSVFRQHQVRHLWDWGVPAVCPGLWLGAVVSIPQSTKVLVGTTQPHSSYTVIQLQGPVNKFQLARPSIFSLGRY